MDLLLLLIIPTLQITILIYDPNKPTLWLLVNNYTKHIEVVGVCGERIIMSKAQHLWGLRWPRLNNCKVMIWGVWQIWLCGRMRIARTKDLHSARSSLTCGDGDAHCVVVSLCCTHQNQLNKPWTRCRRYVCCCWEGCWFFSPGVVGVRAVDAGGDVEKVMILLLLLVFDKCGKKTYYYCSWRSNVALELLFHHFVVFRLAIYWKWMQWDCWWERKKNKMRRGKRTKDVQNCYIPDLIPDPRSIVRCIIN